MLECPRWRLRTPHYIHVPMLPDGTKVEWEHKEQNRDSGRTVRKMFVVPLMLDPRDGADCNYPGEVIVAQDLPDHIHPPRQDIMFEGDPTPDMEPLNEAAEAISEKHRYRWEHPIETLPANGGMNESEKAFMENMMKAFAQQIGATQTASAPTVPKAEFDALKAELEQIKAMLSGQAQPKSPDSTAGRRM